jgi:PAS domain S-box-containing protein
MNQFIRHLFSTDFMPHIYCLRDNSVISLHIASDALVALSYFVIPIALVHLVCRRRDLVFSWMFLLFGAFILSCGLTHVLSIWTLWNPIYRFEGVIKAITAVFSLSTAFLLIRLVPQAVALPNPQELRLQIAERERAEGEVRRLNAELERRVFERTGALKIANSLLAESERRRTLALQAAGMGTWSWDVRGETLVWDDRCRAIFGLTPDEPVTYKRFLASIHPDDRPAVEKALGAALADGSLYDVEFSILWPDGSTHWVRSQGRADDYTDGEAKAMHGIAIDVTERKRLDQALRTSEERFRTVAEAVPDMLFAANPDGSPTFLSARFQEYTGLSADYSDHHFWETVLHADDLPVWLATWYEAQRDARQWEKELLIRRQDGVFRWFVARAIPMRDDSGKIRQWLGACTDIDQLKRTETVLRYSNDELRQFAYAAAHDLQEPLRNIVNSAELIKQFYIGQLDAEADELIKICIEGGARMHGMVKDLLTYTKVIDSAPVTSVANDSDKVLDEALANLGTAIAEAGACVTRESMPLVPAQTTHLLQLFQNLIGNALKYRKSGVSPHIHVRARQERDHWVFSVSDNGIGFNPAYSEKIFGVFKRLHHRHEYPGNGIGLAICARIVAHYGGRIWAEGEQGVGAAFHFTLPVQESMPCSN